MPKGQKRDETTRASEINEQIRRLRERKADLIKAAADKEKRRQQRIAFLLGETLRDADLAGDLTPEEKATIGRILARRKETPADWNLLADWMPEPVPVRPADPVAEAAE